MTCVEFDAEHEPDDRDDEPDEEPHHHHPSLDYQNPDHGWWMA